MQPGKLVSIFPQRPPLNIISRFSLSFFFQAALPEFFCRRIQKNRGPGAQQLAIAFLREGSSPQRDYAIATKSVREQIAECAGFRGPESSLSLQAKNLWNRSPFARLDAGVKIHEVPNQPSGKLSPYNGFAGPHKSNEKNGTNSHGDSQGAGEHRKPSFWLSLRFISATSELLLFSAA